MIRHLDAVCMPGICEMRLFIHRIYTKFAQLFPLYTLTKTDSKACLFVFLFIPICPLEIITRWRIRQHGRGLSAVNPLKNSHVASVRMLILDADQEITGTRVVYVAPEGPDRHLSRISLDIPFVLDIHEPNRSGDKASDQNCQLHTQAKGKLKKLVERLHPDGAFGGARLLGGAIRRRMKTIRKISHSVHRKNKNAPTTGRQGIPSHPLPSHNHLPTLTHNMTINEFGTMSQQANPGDISWPFLISATQRVGTLLSRRNSAPFALDGEVFDISTTENKNTSSRSERQTSPPLHAHKREANPESPQTLLNVNSVISDLYSSIQARTDSGVGELNPRTFNVPDFYSQTLEENVKEAPSPRAKIRTEVDKQMCNLSIIGDSEDTESTIPTPSASILRHQKKKGLEARQFTDAEMTYLENVVRALCNFIIEKALDKSGVQYRNTFAWKFHVPSRCSKFLNVDRNVERIRQVDRASLRIGRKKV